MNQRTYKTVLDRLSWDLAKTLSDDYEVVSINAPTQTDGHNCGFFVMLRLWRMVDNSSALDMAQRSIQIGVRGSAQVTELMGAGTPSQWLAATGWE
ncbi:hypothetical protein PInf_024391 [Phytophthora infestans]|nr:hypothetical protein PInf_024391 [Phytophthora infestans]